MILRVDKKTGFLSLYPVTEIYDKNGIPFYIKKRKGKELRFNLPKGEYLTRQNFSVLPEPIKNKIPNLPEPNQRTRLPKEFKIFFIDNPYKCSVNPEKGLIYFDKSFKKLPKPVIDFVKFHELGHYFYRGQGQKSEKLCDLFAGCVMLQLGYNISQVKWAKEILSDGHIFSRRRKKFINEKFN